MILVLWDLPAAAGDAFDLAGWETTAIEVLPNLGGDTGVRVRQQLGIAAELPADLRVEADGAIRRLAFDEDPLKVDVHRLVVSTGQRRSLQLTLGRTVLLDPRGWIPLDGVVVEGGDATHVNAFAGRLWNPEPLDVKASYVGGLGVVVHPPGMDGLPSRASAVSLSWMILGSDGKLANSITAGGSVRGPRGASGSTDVEVRVDPGETGVRAGIQGTLPVGSSVRFSPELRWEGLSPTGQVVALRTPIEWLAGAGYGVAGLGATFAEGDFVVQARGGAVVHDLEQDAPTYGGQARVGVGLAPAEGPNLGVFALGAGIGSSWVAGGGFEAGWRAEWLRLGAEGGVFRFQPIAGQASPVSELRLRGGTGLGEEDGLDLSVELSAGSDRLLERWMQGGVVLSGWLGGGQNRP